MSKKEILEVFENKFPERDYIIEHIAPEFTSLCPKTGQPDFATIILRYIPDKFCVELKSLKLYYNSYRNDGVFYETLTNQILSDIAEIVKPRAMRVIAKFNVRGGISSVITADFVDEKYQRLKELL
ncbi:MAG: preQ(1) synthase [Ignavibacterium sp.]|nr:preQ(1) synthase [Ignavibacterium sp.]